MGNTRRVAERMIVERTARCRLIAKQLRELATRLDSYEIRSDRPIALGNEARELRALAIQVETL